MTIHGKGDNYRHYLSVQDFLRNVKNYNQGKISRDLQYCIYNKYKVIDVIKMISIHLKRISNIRTSMIDHLMIKFIKSIVIN